MSARNPIAIFDSGVGGLSVAREIRRLLPYEDILYFADSAYCPYGTKPPEEILSRSATICRFLVGQGAKILVVACNTASVAGLDRLRDFFKIPIVGMEPAVKPAAAATRNGRIGVLATGVTLNGDRFGILLSKFASGIDVYTQPCPGLVELVEAGKMNGPEIEEMLNTYLLPLLDHGVDTVVLGCTHYPFLRQVIQEKAGPGINIIDTGEAVARQVHRVLRENNLLNDSVIPGKEIFFTSGDPELVGRIIARILGKGEINIEKVVLT
ncbi:MAG: glutamate racemase [Peptococcaceae bacterium BRH_c4b]|nr:MAG: glutamate racemase [Peptococcaceae bacterium BRH_c4b]